MPQRGYSERPADMPGVLWVKQRDTWARALVDPEDWERFRRVRWCFAAQRYVRGRVNGRPEYLHRLIFDLEPGASWPNGQRVVIDHINRDTLDNRRANLHVGTQADNCANRGGPFEGARRTSPLNKAQVIALSERGMSTRAIARELNLAKTTVQRVVSAHVSAA